MFVYADWTATSLLFMLIGQLHHFCLCLLNKYITLVNADWTTTSLLFMLIGQLHHTCLC